ncbi:hypothetical protein ACRS6P_23310 [Pseudomonas aeruginosa]
MNKANECTCPSGDGSLVHPCPAHPAVEQAGTNVGHGHVFPRADGVKMRCGGPALCSECAADAYRARAALAQPSPAPTEGFTHFPELLESVQQMDAMLKANSAQAEAERLEVVGVRYEDGTILSAEDCGTALEVCAKVQTPLMTVAQHERIVGELRAVIAQLRQHKNDYMDSGQETYRALQNEIREREAEIARLDGLVSGRTAERDAALAEVERIKTISDNYYVLCVERQQQLDAALAEVERLTRDRDDCLKARMHYATQLGEALARVSELEKQEPVALANRGLHAFWVKWTEAAAGLYGPGIKLYAAPVVQAQHCVPELLVRAEDFVSGKEVPQAWLDVQAERRRQITAEGWTPDHDDLYCAAELPRAAAAYILSGANDEAQLSGRSRRSGGSPATRVRTTCGPAH